MDVLPDLERFATPNVTGGSAALHALAMVARERGVHLAPERLSREHGLPTGEPSLKQLARIADVSGLTTRRARLRWSQLGRLGNALPVILRMRDGQSLVLIGVQQEDNRTVAVLRDPLSPDGAVLLVDEIRLSAVWAGEAMFVKRRHGLRAEERPFSFGWIVGQLLQERTIFRDVGVSALMMSLFALVPPLIYMTVVDKVLVHHRLSTVSVLTVAVAFFIVFDTGFSFLRRYLIARGTARVDARLSVYIFQKLLALPTEFFEQNPAGSILYRLGEVWRIRNFLTGRLFSTLLDTMTLVVLIPAMFVLNTPLALWVLGAAILMFVVVALYVPVLSRVHTRVIQAEQRKNSLMVEAIHGMRTIKSLAIEGGKLRDWDDRVAEAVHATTRMQMLSNQPQSILHMLERAIYAGTLLLGSYLAIASDTTLYAGTLVAFSMVASRAVSPFVQIAALLEEVQEIRGAVLQIASVVNVAPEAGRDRRGMRPRIEGAIEFDGVRFRYPGAPTQALSDITLSIPKGSIVGVMGRSGSGKTTIARLLQGLYRNYEGLIKIDSTDLREIDIDHLRTNLGVVLQDNFLFRGTVRENIAMARPNATFEEIVQAARLAGAEEFIERLPRGYDTMIEEGSANLSGGQRQRIAIARALLPDPPVLIFDEATSALDPESEAIVNSNLMRIAQDRTVIVISHRLASLIDCDQILVLDRGKLYDAAPHDTLLERCDIYRQLWFQQNRHLTPGGRHDRAARVPACQG
ncbi:peptidase domain-containing ABC transporter [Azospirillum doebereinerae]|uniref:Peptidase domain-containing ABC transporter n=1 Tax=Azospirillum doebereinerae TaxID=92933 RepID=A0A3S0WPF1_9PROT|nr:peptidase domain-containing ABC transporter [Azospirillum doebereinerae]RUQ75207.1 peptidase domain-containing ABC transporter [Azospirillum doebereinerae]